MNKATVAFYRNKDKENPADATKTLVLGNDHALSKRTTVYASPGPMRTTAPRRAPR